MLGIKKRDKVKKTVIMEKTATRDIGKVIKKLKIKYAGPVSEQNRERY